MTAVHLRALGFDPDRLGAALRSLEADVDARRCDGGTLVVGRRGRTALFETRGYADRERSRPLEPDDVFLSMSLGKQFTNALVLNSWSAESSASMPPSPSSCRSSAPAGRNASPSSTCSPTPAVCPPRSRS